MESYRTIEGHAVAEIEEKKSRFICSLASVADEGEALSFLEEVRAANRMARHNVYAYVLRPRDDGGERVRYSDDGEPRGTAGLPTLQVLQHAGLSDVCAVVTRYFGGVLLGTGGLARAYTQATKAAVDSATVVRMAPCVDVAATIPYALHDRACALAAARGAQVVDSRYAQDVTLTFRVLYGDQDGLRGKLAELAKGTDGIRVGEPFVAPCGKEETGFALGDK